MRTVSIQSLLGRLIWLSMLPLLLLGSYLAVVHVSMIGREIRSQMEHRVEDAATLIDNFVGSQIVALKTLSDAPLLDEPLQLAGFYRVAKGYSSNFSANVILADRSLQMLLNTRVPFGETLPRLPPPRGTGYAAAPTALKSGQPAVSDIVDGPVARQPLVVIVTPVMRNGSPQHLLLSTIETRQIATQLERISLSEGWTLKLLDGKGDVIARHPQTTPASKAGDVEVIRKPIVATGDRWQMVLEVDHSVGQAALHNAIGAIAAALLAAVFASYLFGRRAGRSIETALDSLAAGATAASPLLPQIIEFEVIRKKLSDGAETLRAAELRYRTLFNNEHTVMLLIDPADGRIVDANPAAEKFYGWTRDELRTKRVSDINPMSEAEIRAEMERALKNQRQRFHFQHRKAGGDIADVAIYTNPVEIDGRRMIYSIIHDETERLRAERALHDSEARYKDLFVANPQPMWFFDDETLRFLAVNEAAVSHYGYSREEFLAMTIADIRPPEDIPRLHQTLADHKSERLDLSHAGVWRHRRKDGSEIQVEITSHVLDYNGRPARVILVNDVTERLRVQERVAEYVNRLENAMTGTAEAIAQIMDLRDPYTAGHERRVGVIAAAIAQEMGLSESMQRGLHVAGDLHDLGKITVPVEILAKPGRLSPSEFELIKMHPEKGYQVLKGIDFPWPVAEVAYQHHERMDGSGYPRGLKGDDILLEARILAVADVVEAMSSHRPYRPGFGIDKALAEVETRAGDCYDANVVAACLRLFREKGFRIPD